MKKFKRALASVLALAMLFTSTPSFAAKSNFTDVGSQYAAAVTRLTSIDVLKGYDDGTFRPEATITRAEAAAVMVRILGKEKLAGYSTGLTQFSDMTGHWANGYVNVAASAGIVKGYADGTFGPENQVTYAEMVTMMVRALGAGPAVEANGKWPNNYLNFALMEGLTDDISVIPNAPATRGDVALVANVTLDTPIWRATEYNTDGSRAYATTEDTIFEETLFEDKLELTKYEMYTITMPLGAGALDVDEFEAAFDKNGDGDFADADDRGPTTFTFAEDMVVPVYLGMEVDIWENDDNEVVMIQPADDSKQEVIMFADVTDFSTDSKVEVKLLSGAEKKYDLTTNTVYILNGDNTEDGSNIEEDYDLPGRLILDKDKDVSHLYVYNYDKMFVVEEVDYDEDDNEYDIDANKDYKYTDADLKFNLDDEVVYVINPLGQYISLADIKEGDMIFYADDTNGNYLMVVSDGIVEGTVDGKDSEEIEIDGKEYEYSVNFDAADEDNIESVSTDDEVVAYIDAFGKVAMLEKVSGSKDAASGDYAIIVEAYMYKDPEENDYIAKVKLFDLASGTTTGRKILDIDEVYEEYSELTAGEQATSLFNDLLTDWYDEDEGYYDNTATAAIDDADCTTIDALLDGLVGSIVTYDVDDDEVVLMDVEADEIDDTNGETSDIDVDDEEFGDYTIDPDSVKIYKATEVDDGELEIEEVDWAKLDDGDAEDVVFLGGALDDEEADYIFIPLDGGAEQDLEESNDDSLGIITRVKEITGGDIRIRVVNAEGEVDLLVDEDDVNDVNDLLENMAFDGTTDLELDEEDHWPLFVGLLVSFSADEDGYVDEDSIEFSNDLQVAKFCEITRKDKAEILDLGAVAGASVKYEIFGEEVLVLEADIDLDDAKDETFKTEFGIDDVEESSVSKIDEIDIDDDDEDTFAEAEDEEKSTIYYYLIEVDEDGDFEDLDGSDAAGDNEGAVYVIIFDPNEAF